VITPSQPTEAELAIRDFLLELTHPVQTPAVPEEIRVRATYLLRRHFDASAPACIEQPCPASSDTQVESESDAISAAEGKPSSGTWWGRLLEDPQRTRLKVANIGIVIGIVLALLVAWTSFSLRT